MNLIKRVAYCLLVKHVQICRLCSCSPLHNLGKDFCHGSVRRPNVSMSLFQASVRPNKNKNFSNAYVTKGRSPQVSPLTLRHTIHTRTSHGQGYLGKAGVVGISCPLILSWSRLPSVDPTNCFFLFSHAKPFRCGR